MKRLILLLAVPVTLVAAHAMGGSSDAATVTEAATACGECCPEVVCPEDCCPPDCCPIDAVVNGCEDGCPGAALLSAAADKVSYFTAHVSSVATSLTQGR